MNERLRELNRLMHLKTEPLTRDEAGIFLAIAGHTEHEFDGCLDWRLSIEDDGVWMESIDEKHELEIENGWGTNLTLAEMIHEQRERAEKAEARVAEQEKVIDEFIAVENHGEQLRGAEDRWSP